MFIVQATDINGFSYTLLKKSAKEIEMASPDKISGPNWAEFEKETAKT